MSDTTGSCGAERKTRRAKGPVCNRDCFNCIYEDCIDGSMTHRDYQEQAAIEKELLFPKTAAEKKVAEYQKAYREANREKLAEYQKAYREANREKAIARKKACKASRKAEDCHE